MPTRTDNGAHAVMYVLADYTIPEANKILQLVSERLAKMAENPRPIDPDKPTTDTP